MLILFLMAFGMQGGPAIRVAGVGDDPFLFRYSPRGSSAMVALTRFIRRIRAGERLSSRQVSQHTESVSYTIRFATSGDWKPSDFAFSDVARLT